MRHRLKYMEENMFENEFRVGVVPNLVEVENMLMSVADKIKRNFPALKAYDDLVELREDLIDYRRECEGYSERNLVLSRKVRELHKTLGQLKLILKEKGFIVEENGNEISLKKLKRRVK